MFPPNRPSFNFQCIHVLSPMLPLIVRRRWHWTSLKLNIVLLLFPKCCLCDMAFLSLYFGQSQVQCSPSVKLELPDASLILYSSSISLHSTWSLLSWLRQSMQDSRGMTMREEPSAPHGGIRPEQMTFWTPPKLHIRKEKMIHASKDNCTEVEREELKYFTGQLLPITPPFPLSPKYILIYIFQVLRKDWKLLTFSTYWWFYFVLGFFH